jgi:hypothetical protein
MQHNPSEDMEFLRLNMPEPEMPAARPQHLKFCRDLMKQNDYTDMVKAMPATWKKLFDAIEFGENTFNGKPILRADVNKIVDQLKKCPPRSRLAQDIYGRKKHTEHREVERLSRQEFAERAIEATGRKSEAPNLEDGMYREPNSGTIYKLYHTVHGANVQVAKELIVVDPGQRASDKSTDWIRKPTVRFDYRGRKPLYKLTPEMRLTIEEAKEFGALYGTCCICGRTLTNELSIALGIGPVCGNREFGGDFEFMVEDARQYIDGEVISVNYDSKIAEIEAQMKELES